MHIMMYTILKHYMLLIFKLPVPVNSWYSREVDEKDLEDPLLFFKRNPIFDSISSNMLLGKKIKENSFWREILNMNQLMLSKVAGTAFRSLGAIVVDNHVRGVPLGAAACLENLRIAKSSGRCVLLNIKPRAPETEEGLTLQQRANDWLAIRDLIIRVVELTDGSAEANYPIDFLHWLDKLAEENPRLWLILYHPIFLSMNGRFSYRVAIDQLLKKEPQKSHEAVICDMLRKIGDNLGGLLSLIEKHELLNGVMTYSPRRPAATSKGKTAAVVNPAGQPPSSAAAVGVRTAKQNPSKGKLGSPVQSNAKSQSKAAADQSGVGASIYDAGQSTSPADPAAVTAARQNPLKGKFRTPVELNAKRTRKTVANPAAAAASINDVQPASPADPAAAPVGVNDPAATFGVNDPTTQSTEKKDKECRKKIARLRLNTGRKVVGISRFMVCRPAAKDSTSLTAQC